MKRSEALKGVNRLFLDTAPVIYFVEQHPMYAPIVDVIFQRIDQGDIFAVTSPITLAECLIIPYRGWINAIAERFLGTYDNGSAYAFA